MRALKEIRTAAGFTQKGLAERSGVNVRMIQHYEQGFKDITKAPVNKVYALAKALNCTIEELIKE